MTSGWSRVVVKEWASRQESWILRVRESALFCDWGSNIIHLRCAGLCTMLYVYSCPLSSLQLRCITSTSLEVRVLNVCSQWHTCDRYMMVMGEEGSRPALKHVWLIEHTPRVQVQSLVSVFVAVTLSCVLTCSIPIWSIMFPNPAVSSSPPHQIYRNRIYIMANPSLVITCKHSYTHAHNFHVNCGSFFFANINFVCSYLH